MHELNKYPSVAFRFPHAVGGSRIRTIQQEGLAFQNLIPGALWVHSSVWVDVRRIYESQSSNCDVKMMILNTSFLHLCSL
jgi:hypothetical protein